MRTLILDAETFYAQDFTLSHMTNEEYVRDRRFQTLCLGVKAFGLPDMLVCRGPEEVARWCAAQDWSDIAAVMHHAQFDGFILSEVYHVKPAFIFDTLSMAHAVNGPLEPAALGSLADRYGLAGKTVPYNYFKGKRWEQMSEQLQDELCDGCAHDCELTEDIFKRLVQDFPRDELEIIDQTVRMYTEPRMWGDAELFEKLATEEEGRKTELLAALNVPKKALSSNATFTRLLEAFGEEVPSKPGKNGPNPCVAASDAYMIDNMDRDDAVGQLIRCRMGVKSTIQETRAGRLAGMARRGPLPVYLKYAAAMTMRWGGGEKTNIQNLPHDGPMRSGLCAENPNE
jgi:hypothetical protein